MELPRFSILSAHQHQHQHQHANQHQTQPQAVWADPIELQRRQEERVWPKMRAAKSTPASTREESFESAVGNPREESLDSAAAGSPRGGGRPRKKSPRQESEWQLSLVT